MDIARLLLIARTLPNLRAAQLVHKLMSGLGMPRIDGGPPPPLRALSCRPERPISKPRTIEADGSFTLINLNRRPDGWEDPSVDRLWLFNLHYFDDLAADADPTHVERQAALIARWISENPRRPGVAWNPYPVSLRVVNWIKWHILRRPLTDEAIASLALQGRSLERSLEYDSGANHLLANAKALIFLGLFFEGEEAVSWLTRGLRLMSCELRKQILSDGGHYERSPMYQSILAEDLLDLLWFAGLLLPPLSERLPLAAWRVTAAAMLGWLRIMTHPDGQIALFNDAAFGVAPEPGVLFAYARSLGVEAEKSLPASGIHVLPVSGYVRLQTPEAAVFFDAASLGPRHQMAHAHADTLSFEMSLFGRRLFVNGGTSRYGAGAGRDSERGTAAHNTIGVDGRHSSEVWESFRVARFARPTGLTCSDKDGMLTVSAMHDGFCRQNGGPLHHRTISLSDGRLVIADRLIGGRWRTAEAWLHVAPGTQIVAADDRHGGIMTACGRNARWRWDGAVARINQGFYHPRFYSAEPQAVLAGVLDGSLAAFSLDWSTYRDR
jgi:uncharacterized heparinase superfamily protein